MSDPTYWHDLILVGGTLAGGGLAYWAQSRQRQHKDLVRFHQVRLETYDQYFRAAMTMMITATTWAAMQPNNDLPLENFIGKAFTKLNETYPRVRLVASTPVAELATQWHTKLISVLSGAPLPFDLQAYRSACIAVQIEFEVAVRRELGIGTAKDSWPRRSADHSEVRKGH
jgi:4-amino-4-deoxy-L-arabinose transferase-like glycosyltransferase